MVLLKVCRAVARTTVRAAITRSRVRRETHALIDILIAITLHVTGNAGGLLPIVADDNLFMCLALSASPTGQESVSCCYEYHSRDNLNGLTEYVCNSLHNVFDFDCFSARKRHSSESGRILILSITQGYNPVCQVCRRLVKGYVGLNKPLFCLADEFFSQ